MIIKIYFILNLLVVWENLDVLERELKNSFFMGMFFSCCFVLIGFVLLLSKSVEDLNNKYSITSRIIDVLFFELM